jgi:hypothetical protein
VKGILLRNSLTVTQLSIQVDIRKTIEMRDGTEFFTQEGIDSELRAKHLI